MKFHEISFHFVRGRKNILQAHTPTKKIHGELRGWKKIHAYIKSPNPPSEVKWLAPNEQSLFSWSCDLKVNSHLIKVWNLTPEILISLKLRFSWINLCTFYLDWFCNVWEINFKTSSNRRLVECVRLQPLSTPKLGKERVCSAFWSFSTLGCYQLIYFQ